MYMANTDLDTISQQGPHVRPGVLQFGPAGRRVPPGAATRIRGPAGGGSGGGEGCHQGGLTGMGGGEKNYFF